MNVAKLAERLTPDDEPSPFSGDAPPGDPPPDPDPYGVRVMLRNNLRHLSVADLETDPPPQKFVLYPYFPAEQPSVFAAPGGTGKTTFLTYLAVCRALGRPMFGRPEMTPTEGETVILSTEDRLEDYRRKIAALRVELGEEFDARRVSERIHFLDLSGVPIRLVEAEKGNFLPTSTAGHLAAILREDVPHADLVIMETVSRLAGGVETNESLSILVEAAQLVCREAGVAVVLVAHTSQEAARQGIADAYTPRGGSALGDNARSTVVLQRINDNNRRTYAADAEVSKEQLDRLLVLENPKPNGAPRPPPLLLERASTKHGPVLRPVSLKPKETDPVAQRSKLLELVGHLASSGAPVTARRLARQHAGELGCSRREVEDLVRDALDAGELVSDGKANGGGFLLKVAR